MKLLQRTSRYYLFFSSLIFLILGVVLFFILRYTLNRATDEGLHHTRPALARYLTTLDELESSMLIMDEIVEFTPIETVSSQQTWRDTLIMDNHPDEMEMEPYRKYTYDELVKGKPYQISISLSKVENEDLIKSVFGVVMAGLLLFLLAINALNRYLSRELWRPFYKSVDQIKQFSVQQHSSPVFDHSETTEFEDLNRSLEGMTAQLSTEYDTLRRFTENASHELQTPLAIIRNEIDLLLRVEERTEKDYGIIQRISEAVSRLGKLNQSLLLLTKIERGQFPVAKWLDLAPLINHKLDQLKLSIQERNILLTTSVEPTPVHLPAALADVLLNNLLGNAIKHNRTGGKLVVSLTEKKLTISNTGPPLAIDPGTVFDRFVHGKQSATSLGLGLAIVKEICDKFGIGLRYHNEGDMHQLIISF